MIFLLRLSAMKNPFELLLQDVDGETVVEVTVVLAIHETTVHVDGETVTRTNTHNIENT